jgi:hypothetical protein
MKELLTLLCFLSLFTGCGSDAPAPETPEKVYSSLDPTDDVEPAKPVADAPKMELGSRRLTLIKNCPVFNKPDTKTKVLRFYKKKKKMMVWLIEDPAWVTVYTKSGTLTYMKRSCFEKGK